MSALPTPEPSGVLPPEPLAHGDEGHGESLWRGAFQRLRRSPMAIAGALIILVFVVVAALAPLIAPYETSERWTNLSTNVFVQGPTAEHLLGVDAFGKDMVTQLLYGARQSLIIGVISTAFGLTFGSILGILAGGLGGKVDLIVMRFVDVLLSIPSLLLAVSIAALMAESQFGLMIAIGLAQVPIFARLLRGSMISQANTDYVLAGRALGLRKRTLVLGHMLPNSLGPTIVQATLNLATATIEVAALSFLGLGGDDPSVAEWGRMVVEGEGKFTIAPWLVFYPGLCIAITALGFTLFGEALREALDPKQRR